MQSEERIFLENPSTYLNIENQLKIRGFLEAVLSNGKIVDASFFEDAEDKENAPIHNRPGILLAKKNGNNKLMAPRKLFQNKSNDAGPVPESPHIYVSSPAKGTFYSPDKSPLRDFLSVSGIEILYNIYKLNTIFF